MRKQEIITLWVVIVVACFIVISGASGQDLDTPQTRMRPIGTQTSNSPYWKWSDPASYHDSIVRVSVPNGAGTGVIIKTEGTGVIVLTNHHVVDVYSAATVRTNYATSTFKVIYKSSSEDLAILYNRNATVNGRGIPVGNYIPQIGEQVEICGYGGPESSRLRHFVGHVKEPEYPTSLSVNCAVISGDSGSPIIHNGCVVGVQFGGPHRVEVPGSWSLVGPCTSHVTGPELAGIFRRYCPQGCTPQYVQPQYIQPGVGGGSQGQDDSWMYPPSGGGGIPQQPNELLPPTNGQSDFIPPSTPPSGLQGPPGEKGEKGDKGDAGEVTAEQLAAMVALITQQLKDDPGMKGPPGDSAPPITDEQIQAALLSYLERDPFTVSLLIRDPKSGQIIRDSKGKPAVDIATVVPMSKLDEEYKPYVRESLQITLPAR